MRFFSHAIHFLMFWFLASPNICGQVEMCVNGFLAGPGVSMAVSGHSQGIVIIVYMADPPRAVGS